MTEREFARAIRAMTRDQFAHFLTMLATEIAQH
jgi:hypothetical protein